MSGHDALPVLAVLPQLISALRQGAAAVLQAPTGAGKTCCVPPAILEAGLLAGGKLLLLQPRRVAARLCAANMARLRGEPLGRTIGYQIRFEKKAGPRVKKKDKGGEEWVMLLVHLFPVNEGDSR